MTSASREADNSFDLPWDTPPEELLTLERERFARWGEGFGNFFRLVDKDLVDKTMKGLRLDGVRELREKLLAVDASTLLPQSSRNLKVVMGMFDLLLDQTWSAGLSGSEVQQMLQKLLPLGQSSLGEYTKLPEADRALERLIFQIEGITLADFDGKVIVQAFQQKASPEDLEKARPHLEIMKDAQTASGRERELADAWKSR